MKTIVTIKELLAYHESLLKKISVVLTIIVGCGLLLVGQRQSFADFADPAASCAGVVDVPESECQALLAIYNSTNGDSWTNSGSWGDTGTICSWLGITCDGGHVTQIYLGKNNLVGTIPSAIGNLPALTSLSVNTNSIEALPAEIGNLTGLFSLNVSINSLTSLPAELENLVNLMVGGGLNIHYNDIVYSGFSETLLAFIDAKHGVGIDWRTTQNIVCGDTVLNYGETCDDGNTEDGDGCSSTCQTEGIPAVCGNGDIEGEETCDDSNTENSDGCDEFCQVEEVCGDGILTEAEQCDDGNTEDGDGCDNACTIEDGWACNDVSPTVCTELVTDDLQIHVSLLDDYVNSGSMFLYQIDYFNNSNDTNDNVSLTLDMSRYVQFIGAGTPYDSTESYNDFFGGADDPCMVDLLNETGVYMGMLDERAGSIMGEMYDMYGLLLVYPDTSASFAEAPYNGQADQVGEFIRDFSQAIYGTGEHGSIWKLFNNFATVDLRDYAMCGSEPNTLYHRDIGTLAGKVGGSIIVLAESIRERFVDIIDIGDYNDISGGTVTENVVNLPDSDTEDYNLGFSWTNESASGTVSMFLNKTGGPIMYSNDTMIDSLIEDGMTDKEKAIILWQFVKDYTFNFPSADSYSWFIIEQGSNPVHYLNSLYGRCNHINKTLLSLAKKAGIEEVRMMSLDGHAIAEMYLEYDGTGHRGMFDADGGVYRENSENGMIYSIDELIADNTIIINNPQNNRYGTELYLHLLNTTGDNYVDEILVDYTGDENMNIVMYPQDKIDYNYTYLGENGGDDGDINYGQGIITRNLSTYHKITDKTENGFIYEENLPYLVQDIEIIVDQPVTDNIYAYLTIGDTSEVLLGELYKSLGYLINPADREKNYYDYDLRFECAGECDIDALIPQITITNNFIFNSVPLNYTGDLSMYLISPDENFDHISVQGSYGLNNQLQIVATITGDNADTNTANNVDSILFSTKNTPYVVASFVDMYFKNSFLNKGYIEDSEDSLFDTSGVLFGYETISFANTDTLYTNIILASEDNNIQANIGSGTQLSFGGEACDDYLVTAPAALTTGFADEASFSGEVQKVFKIGSPCTGTRVDFSEEVTIKVAMDSTGDIQIKSSEDGETWTDEGTETTDEDGVLTFTTDHFSFFALAGTTVDDDEDDSGDDDTGEDYHYTGTGINPQLIKDVCPDGDYSPSFYDKICGEKPSHGVACSVYTDELNEAYTYAFGNGITTLTDCKEADLYGTLLRSHMAKMMSNFALNVLKKTPDTTRDCSFTDMDDQSTEMQGYAITACQLGLMGVKTDGSPDTVFNPDDLVTRAQFGTILSRLLWGDLYNGGDIYYRKHLDALKEAGIMNKINDPLAKELRGRVMLMLMRIANLD